MTTVMLLLILFAGTAVPVLAGDPDLAAARASLESARGRLKAAKGDFDGHRTRAVELVNDAIEQIDAGLKADARDDRKDAKKGAQIEKKIDKLEHRKEQLGR